MDFTNREIATLIWLAIFITWAISNRTVRGALGALVRVMFAGPIVRVLTSALVYVALCIFALERLGIWDLENSKTTLLWVVSFAILSVFDFKRLMEERLFFRNVLREILSLTVVLMLLTDTYTFGLIAELAIIPFATALALVQAVPAKKPDEQRVQRIVGNLLALLGLGYLAHSAYQAFVVWADFATVSTARDFAIPIFLSVMFLPFLYWLRLYATYEQIFGGLSFAIPDKKLRTYARFRSILAFRQNLDLLKRWRRMMNVDQPTNKQAIKDSFRELRRLRRIERNPPNVPPEEGWSPYAAKQFLASEGFETDDYHRSYGDEWRCQSIGVKGQETTFAPTLTYYVSGSERAATRLELELNVFNCEDPAGSDEKFWLCCGVLLGRALPAEAAREVAAAIGEAEIAEAQAGFWKIALTREELPSAIGTSYERLFQLQAAPSDSA